MPTDSSTQTVEVKAPVADVLAVIRDVESQATWIPEVREVELLEGRLQTGQEGRLMLEELAPDRTSTSPCRGSCDVTSSTAWWPARCTVSKTGWSSEGR